MITWTTVFIQMQWCLLISLHFQLFTSQFRGIPAHPSARFGWTLTKTPLRHCLSQAVISMVSKPKALSPVSPQFSNKIKRLLQITELSALLQIQVIVTSSAINKKLEN